LAKELLKRDDLSESIQVLEDLSYEFPADQEVTDLLTYARHEQYSRERSRAIEAASTHANSLIQSYRFDDAVVSIKDELKLYPDDAVLSRLLRSVIAGQLVHEKQRALDRDFERIRELRQQ
jgi:hypothetical protein